MSRKFDRHLKVNTKVLEILTDPATMHYLAGKLIRRKPKMMPRFIWKALLLMVLVPETKKPTKT